MSRWRNPSLLWGFLAANSAKTIRFPDETHNVHGVLETEIITRLSKRIPNPLSQLNVSDIKETDLTERLNNLVNTFECHDFSPD